MPCDSTIRLLTLAPHGSKKIEWVKEHMSVLNFLQKEFTKSKPFQDKNIVMRLHIEATTGCLALLLRDAGANVTLVEADPLTTQNDVAASLYEDGITVFGEYGVPIQKHQDYQREALACKPHILVDTGGILTHLLHKDCSQYIENYIGSSEESTTGVKRLRQMEKSQDLKYPVIAVNSSLCKYLFENLHGTGESVWTSILNTTNLVLAGKCVIVVGYGWCGKGIARKGRAMGARVIICEANPVKASEAILDGFQSMSLEDALPKANYVITATGNADVLNSKHFNIVSDKSILVNAGHSNVEINKSELEAVSIAHEEVSNNIHQYNLENGKKIYLLAEGRVVNSAAGDGQPAEVMDISFGLHVKALEYLLKNNSNAGKVNLLPKEINDEVASIYLQSMKTELNPLTSEQENYEAKWPF